MKKKMKVSSQLKLTKDERFEREREGQLNGRYWFDRLIEYQPAYTDLTAMVAVLMRVEPEFQHPRTYNWLRDAIKAQGNIKNVELLRLTVETIRRHIASNPAVERDYKAQIRARMQGFTGKVKVPDSTADSLDEQALRAKTTKHTQRHVPARH